MSIGNFIIPEPYNEPVYDYRPGSPERKKLQEKYQELRNHKIEIPLYINGQEHKTGNLRDYRPPHDHQRVIAKVHQAGEKEVNAAIEAALAAREKWANTSLRQRAGIFLTAAELISTKYRYLFNAATMLGQSKTCHQSEIDAICELVDFLRYNVKYAEEICSQQPYSPKGNWNWVEYRALEGFVYAVTPFNFTAISGNLPTAPAIMGNVVVWKPSPNAMYSAHFFMQILMEAGLPPGVINLVEGDVSVIGDLPLKHPEFAGVNFTGSTTVFQNMWKTIGDHIHTYKSYPRIVGETGGKDFMMIHKSAPPKEVATAMIRGAFEFQGQKCSAASRAYVPDNLWPQIKEHLMAEIPQIRAGEVGDFGNFLGAVIDHRAFDKVTGYIKRAEQDPNSEIIIGGQYDNSVGYFVQPTIILASDPHALTMEEEIFGPVLTVYVYPADEYEKTIEICNATSKYGLTGGVFAQEEEAIEFAYHKLRDAAGNFYINDKITGSIVGQQPFGGARASGTNDKAGSSQNLLRWTSARAVKQNFAPPSDYRYPFLASEG